MKTHRSYTFLMQKMVFLLISTFASGYVSPARSQHQHFHQVQDTSKTWQAEMSSLLIPSVPMQRDGSGTSWLPDSSPMYAVHWRNQNWRLMFHGAFFLRYLNQNIDRDNRRGGDSFDAPNWFMLMAGRRLGEKGHLMLRGMISFDRLTEGGNGYPLLFQTGETWKGEALVDRQHPHDLFSELSVAYSHELSPRSSLFFYFGLPGEPALGPTVFMHRPSAMHIADATLGHHWQDNTHITFGVATLGWQYKNLKLDGSIFTGREPGENRFNIDKPRFDSYSARLSLNPTERVAMQVSHGFIKRPEGRQSPLDVRRSTASIIYNRLLNDEVNWVTTLLWGLNKPENGVAEHSLLIESDLQFQQLAFFGRFEWVEKPPEELGLISLTENKFKVNALTLGTTRKLLAGNYLNLNLGTTVTLNFVQNELRTFYGKQPLSFEVFLQLTPPRMQAHDMKNMEM